WKLLERVPAAEILAHRILWSLVFTTVLLAVRRRWTELRRILGERRNRWYLLGTAILIGANWFIYIQAVNTGHLVESSLGYFITPLLNVLFGLVFLGEVLGAAQGAALALAAAGVVVRAVQYGSVPWIALGLALTFAIYGLLKKAADLDGVVGLLAETAVLAPAALGYVLFRHGQGAGAFGAGPAATLLLAGTGIVTAAPLLWFAEGARRVPLATVGFAQYVSPSLQLCLGVLVYRERFSPMHAASFGLIWCALAVFTAAQWKRSVPSARGAGGRDAAAAPELYRGRDGSAEGRGR
ncbi:MAG: EamA family transporter RarD, partial [Bacteroidota bacterium]